jgi:hypothetical protein
VEIQRNVELSKALAINSNSKEGWGGGLVERTELCNEFCNLENDFGDA